MLLFENNMHSQQSREWYSFTVVKNYEVRRDSVSLLQVHGEVSVMNSFFSLHMYSLVAVSFHCFFI